jgi:hypothetical protein
VVTERRRPPPKDDRSAAGAVFGAALSLALLLSAAFVGLRSESAGAGAAVYLPLFGLLREWVAVAWGLVLVAGLRWVWRR